jgi:hypothetical protein
MELDHFHFILVSVAIVAFGIMAVFLVHSTLRLHSKLAIENSERQSHGQEEAQSQTQANKEEKQA